MELKFGKSDVYFPNQQKMCRWPLITSFQCLVLNTLDSLYNAGVKHSLSVNTRKSLCGGIFTLSLYLNFVPKNGFVTIFHLK